MDVEFLPDTCTHMCLHTRAHVPAHTLTHGTLGRRLRPTERAVLVHETVPPGSESLPGRGPDSKGGAELQPRSGEQDRGWEGAEGRTPERGFQVQKEKGEKSAPPAPQEGQRRRGDESELLLRAALPSYLASDLLLFRATNQARPGPSYVGAEVVFLEFPGVWIPHFSPQNLPWYLGGSRWA